MHHVHGAKEMQSHDAASNNNVPIKVQKEEFVKRMALRGIDAQLRRVCQPKPKRVEYVSPM
jgi:hypothetical protein